MGPSWGTPIPGKLRESFGYLQQTLPAGTSIEAEDPDSRSLDWGAQQPSVRSAYRYSFLFQGNF